MLSLAHVHISHEELVRVSRRGHDLRLVLNWPRTDLPVLIDLPECCQLRFEHLAHDRVGVPVHLHGWTTRSRTDPERMTVLLRLVVGHDDAGQPTTP